MTTESLMVHALQRGLLLADFNVLSVGMILDYINKYDVLTSNHNTKKEEIIMANQREFNMF